MSQVWQVQCWSSCTRSAQAATILHARFAGLCWYAALCAHLCGCTPAAQRERGSITSFRPNTGFFCCALPDSFGAAGKQKRNRRFAFCPHPSRLLHCTHTHGTVTHHHLIHLSLNCVHVNAARCATIAKKVSPGQARHGPAGGPAPRLVLLLHTLQAAVVAEICVFVCFSSYVCGQQLYRAVGSWHVLCALTCHPCS